MAGRPTRYTYYTADLATGVITDELPLYDVTFSTELNEAGEFRARLPLGDPRITVHRPRELTEPGRAALYVERDGVLVWGGVVWTVKYTSADQHLEIGAAGFLSYFDHRRVLPAAFDPAGTGDLASVSVPFTDRDQSDIARELVAVAQEHPDGDIRVRPESGALSGITRTLVYPGSDLKSTGEALRELASLENGPDFVFDMAYGSDGRPVRRLRVGTPQLGRQGTPHVWEYGANLIGYTWPADGASTATRVFALGEQGESGQLVAVVEAGGTGRPLTETEISYVHLTDVDLLRSQARSALAAVSAPVVLPELTVRADLEPVLGSYQVGDDALVVIKDVFFPEGTEFGVRITGIEVTPGNDAGEEQVQLTVTPVTGTP
ncbi:hypothetical protein TUSST3_89410 [Streptomyces sp. TUS-ST3]|uniref:hypothetical protein n=1 Tax=Streptomyces sp. TUS-ST3 TaxID=3025591 RepID=UPI00235B54C8|nr:hypothetical protein [Streptomyces sp. TUS-ST3]GLP72323.1 hypothetical protein TUSST3_89410 [Streptomyces sp. TUS-ST3]